jgi:2-polyprenyl-3-methyl-5-hydroxy-6-metoxy-1,4-benzoquinol methylase
MTVDGPTHPNKLETTAAPHEIFDMSERIDDHSPPQPIVWDERLLQRFWSFYANQPETYFSFAKGADIVRHARGYLKEGDLVLDYGCGPGFLLHELLKAGFSAGGADISVDVIGRNGPALGSQKNLLGLFAIDELLQEGRTFDAIFLIEVVEHLYDDALAATLRNCRTLLKPGGRLFVTTPNDERLEDSIVYCPVSNVTFHRWQHVRSWNSTTLPAALRKHGFAVDEVITCTFRDHREQQVSPLRRTVRRVLDRLRKPTSLFVIAR